MPHGGVSGPALLRSHGLSSCRENSRVQAGGGIGTAQAPKMRRVPVYSEQVRLHPPPGQLSSLCEANRMVGATRLHLAKWWVIGGARSDNLEVSDHEPSARDVPCACDDHSQRGNVD